MQTNEVNGIFKATGANIYFETKGEGESILFLHAGIADSRMWDNEFHLLSEKYHVIRLDLPGFGLSDLAGGKYSYSNIINEILVHLGVNHIHIVAASFGGKIAIDFYLEYSEKCLSLALMSPALGGWKDSNFLQQYEAEEEKLLQEGKIEETSQFNYKTWILRNRAPELIEPYVKHLILDMQMNSLTKAEPEYVCKEIETKDNISQIKNIQIPVLIINGDYDVEDFHDIAELMYKEIANVKKHVIFDAAHLANLESPEYFLQLVSEFLSDNSNYKR